MQLSTLLSLFAVVIVALGNYATASSTYMNLRPDEIGAELQKAMIWVPANVKLQSPFVAFRRQFEMVAIPERASLHLFADVRYILWINGTYVSRGPVRFEPKGPEYDSIEVAEFLHVGSNEMVVLVLGDQSNGKMMRHAPGLTAQLETVVGDGRPALTVLRTDPSWRWSDHTRYRAPKVDWGNVLDRIDARLDDGGDWTKSDYDDSKWQTAEAVDGGQWGPLSARRIPLLRETPIAPLFVSGQVLPATLSAGQKVTFKLDRLVQAYTVLNIDADMGTEISLDYAGIHYIAGAGHQTYISSDTHGFAGGTITVKSGRAILNKLAFVERLYPFDRVGSFHSSDPLLDKIWGVCARSLEVTSEDAYVDCADRERTEWMDCDPPAFDVTRTAFAGPGPEGSPLFADARLLEEMLRRTALTLQPDGWVKAHTCSDRFDIHAKMEDRTCDWVEGARRYYESTGNSAPIQEIWPAIASQMNYFLERRSPRGLVVGREWEVWGNPIGYVTCEGAGLNAFIYKALIDAAFLGRVIGRAEEANIFDKAGQDLAVAFNNVLWNESDGAYFSGYYPDHANAMADSKSKKSAVPVDEHNLIAPTLFPSLFAVDQRIVPADRQERVRRYVLANREQAARVMTFYYLFRQMFEADSAAMDREVLDTIRKKWKGMADWPWQTTWEEFTGGSKAHGYGMFPGYFLSAYVLGVRPEFPLSRRQILIEPRLGGLSTAGGTVVTEFGAVPILWRISEDRTLTFDFTLPINTRAIVRLTEIDAGTLMVDGKATDAKLEGRYAALELGPGHHAGSGTIRLKAGNN